jgi:dihydroneopterin aldolase/2-amino-4-hydroxy-6-hydroxymethyldihydropteridine diphosphokinase
MIIMEVFLGIGANLGNRENNLKEAVARVEEYIGKVTAFSSIYETEAWGFQTEDEFLNMVLKVETKLKPSGLLGRILMIESLLGRIRITKQYSSRVIDIDILFYGNKKINDVELIIPHPRLHERKFILVPLCEIAPDLIHPVMNKSIAALLKSCKDESKVKKFHSNPLSAKL